MRTLLNRLQCISLVCTLLVCVAVFGGIEGTYVLDTRIGDEDSAEWKPRETTLKISMDEDEQYSATLKSPNSVLNTKDVALDDNEFQVKFLKEASPFDLELTYAGTVEDGKMSGTITASMDKFSAESQLIGSLKKPGEEEPDQNWFKSDDVLASVSVFGGIEGTYVLNPRRDDEDRPVWKQRETTLTISVAEDEEYSATLKSPYSTMSTEDVELDANEFQIKFFEEASPYDIEFTYAGTVEDGKMSGTITASTGDFSADSELIGNLKKPVGQKPD